MDSSEVSKIWREEILACAREPQSEFTALRPAETGLPMTVYASERDDLPALIVDSQPGMQYVPSLGSQAYKIGESTGGPAVDRWVAQNAETLQGYAYGKFDTVDFYKRMRPVQSA